MVKKKRDNEDKWTRADWIYLEFIFGIIAMFAIGFVVLFSTIPPPREREEIPQTATLLRVGTVEDIEFFQYGALNESRTFINFSDTQSLIVGGYHPLEENVRYAIWYQEYPYEFDGNVPDTAHVTLVRREEI